VKNNTSYNSKHCFIGWRLYELALLNLMSDHENRMKEVALKDTLMPRLEK